MSSSDPSQAPGSSLPFDLERALRDRLEPDERIVWIGTPTLDAAAKAATPAVIFGVVLLASAAGFGAIIISWILSSQSAGRPVSLGTWLPALVMIPFIVIGFLLISRPRRALRLARSTAYALTDRRAIILTLRKPDDARVASFTPERLHPMVVKQREDGTGSVFFGYEDRTPTDPDAEWSVSDQPVRVGFLNIEHPRKVEHLIRATLG